MNILITPNNLYAGHAGVLLTSIFENNKRTDFHVYILTTGFTESNISRMKILAQNYNQKIDIIQLSAEDANLEVPGRWGISTYIKLLAPKYIDVDRILYLDIDMIVVGDIAAIEKYDIADYYAAIPPDVSLSENHKVRLGIPKENFYGCCGVVWINMKRWREDHLLEKFWKFLYENVDKIQFADQDIINPVCTGKILKLPMRFNLMAFFFRNVPLLTEEGRSDFLPELKKAVIIHYTCTKPWFWDSDFPLKGLYWKYEKLSPWNIPYIHSQEFKWIQYCIKKVRYFMQYIGLEEYSYLFISSKKLKRLMNR